MDEPQFLSIPRYLKYLDDYCTAFALWPHIYLSSPVVSVSRRVGGGHVIRYKSKEGEQEIWECDAVAICCGLHDSPERVEVPGLEKVPVVIHSSEFKERKQFGENKTVAILGVGESSMDIAYLAITAPTKRVVICHKRGFINTPKVDI